MRKAEASRGKTYAVPPPLLALNWPERNLSATATEAGGRAGWLLRSQQGGSNSSATADALDDGQHGIAAMAWCACAIAAWHCGA